MTVSEPHSVCNGDVADFQEVKVDQRALVDILARYPGEFDVLRELIQNADDANAKNVEVHFQTEDPENPQPAGGLDISKVKVRKWKICNNGNRFTEEDWGKLTKIADGNKNSTKVGAFGVGFYSVLSKTDHPIVKSSGKLLMFVRGKDEELRSKLVDCPTALDTTSIELELRGPEPLHNLPNLARFLVSSVSFLANTETASVYLDDTRLLHIEKESRNPPVDIEIPTHLVGTTQALTVGTIQRKVQRINIDAAECMLPAESLAFLPTAETADTLVERRGRSAEVPVRRTSQSVNTVLEDAIIHDLYTATTHVNLPSDSDLRIGVESCMKTLPSMFECKAIYFNPEQSDALDHIKNSRSPKARRLASLFSGPQGIVPENDSGRLFIGQSTNQTTGIALHISAHFLPTMERSSIDLANGHIAAWNEEVFRVSGFLARIVYEEEMHVAKSRNDLATNLGLSTMARFTFGPTVPHNRVSQMLQEAFYSCCHESKSPLPVVSAVGISCASDLHFRQSNRDLSFLKRYRVLHEGIKDQQRLQIIKRYSIPSFKFTDILKEFEIGVTPEAMKSFLAWWDDARKNSLTTDGAKSAAKDFCMQFASRGVLHTSDGVKVELKGIKYYTFFPLPNGLSRPDIIYIDVSSGLPSRDTVEAFGWCQLPLLDWLVYAHARAQQHTLDGASGPESDMGYRVSRVLVQFTLVKEPSPEQWVQVADLMKDLKCVPTNMGLKTPGESYFEEADVCNSLPVALEPDFLSIPVTPVAGKIFPFEHKSVTTEHIRKVLFRIRVRLVMDWKHMIENLEDGASEETNDRLLQFLGRRADILHALLPPNWRSDLREKKAFYSSGHGRLSATELYLSHEDMLKLKLPVLALPQGGLASLQNIVDPSGLFPMERFIESLGVRKHPPLEKVIALAASSELGVQQFSRQYLLSNLGTYDPPYKPEDFTHVAFIPTQRGSLARLNEVFGSPTWEKLGFKLVSKDLGRDYLRLGVRDDPSVDMIIDHLRAPSTTLPDLNTAAMWFEHLYLHGNFPAAKLQDQLSTIPFVPVKNASALSSESIDYIAPKDCFVVSTEAKTHHHGFFPFVDFGPSGNSFLQLCGAKKSPDASDIVRKLCQGPRRYLEEALHNNYDFYLEDLRTITSHLDSIPDEDKQAMKKAPMFFASRIGEKVLLPADQVIIGDWESRDFGGVVFEAPKDSSLEKMYNEMGSEFLGKYVQYDIHPTDPQADRTIPFGRTYVIQRIKCFMDQRDDSTKTNVSFCDQNAASYRHLEMKACKKLMLKKTFAPPFGILTDGEPVRTTEAKVKAGLEFNEPDELYTLWTVPAKGENELGELRNDIAVGLCNILLKTYGPNDVLLLASLFTMDDEHLCAHYRCEVMAEPPALPPTKAKSKNWVTVELVLPLVGRVFGGLKSFTPRIGGKRRAIPPDDDVTAAIKKSAIADQGSTPDFTTPSQSRPGSVRFASHCKEACKIALKERGQVEVEGTCFRFFLANGALRQHREPALKEFARLVNDLAHVYGLDTSTACYIFWKDTDEDLMAFNRDQRYIFFNLAYHEREIYKKREEKKVITEWFLIMAHELAHNITLDHDEYHGTLTSRIAVAHFPALRKKFSKHFSDDDVACIEKLVQ